MFDKAVMRARLELLRNGSGLGARALQAPARLEARGFRVGRGFGMPRQLCSAMVMARAWGWPGAQGRWAHMPGNATGVNKWTWRRVGSTRRGTSPRRSDQDSIDTTGQGEGASRTQQNFTDPVGFCKIFSCDTFVTFGQFYTNGLLV